MPFLCHNDSVMFHTSYVFQLFFLARLEKYVIISLGVVMPELCRFNTTEAV